MTDNSVHVVIAAIILGLSMLGGAYLVAGSIDRAAEQIPEFEAALKSMQGAVAAAAGAAPRAPAAPKRRRGPDPSKVYTLASAGSPSKGAANAKVTIVEFSDFQ